MTVIQRNVSDGKRPRPIDTHVGSRLRLRRTWLGWSQTKLAEALGLTFQQVQKYERGLNRVSASRLFNLSQQLDVPVSFFFDAMPDELVASLGPVPRRGDRSLEPDGASDEGALMGREKLDLIRAYYRIVPAPVRKRVLVLIKSMSAVQSRSSDDAPLVS